MIVPMLGLFDSGFGGLTILRALEETLPTLDLVYLSDNAHAPYGDREPEEIFSLSVTGVRTLVGLGCPLVIVACNTASAIALRRIQQDILPTEFPDRRVLGVIRPSVEVLATRSRTKHLGIIGTEATVLARAYSRECHNLDPHLIVNEVSCPELVPYLETGTISGPEVEDAAARASLNLLRADPTVNTVLLGCTHFPLATHAFRRAFPPDVEIVTQGPIVADKLVDYLARHPEMNERLPHTGSRRFLTTGEPGPVSRIASALLRRPTVFERAPVGVEKT